MTDPSPPRFNKEDLERMVEEAGYWFHSIDLGQGVVTPGRKPLEDLNNNVEWMKLPSVRGKSVLDIGTYDGWFAFHCERDGASRVVALDHYVWELDMVTIDALWKEANARGATFEYDADDYRRRRELPGKRPFDTAHRVLNSKIEPVYSDFMTVDTATLGTFEVVLYLGVLYHVQHPLEAMRRLASVTAEGGVAIIHTNAVVVPGFEDIALCELLTGSQFQNDPSNWWLVSEKAMLDMCEMAGFKRAEIVATSEQPTKRLSLRERLRIRTRIKQAFRKPAVTRPHIIIHAWK